MVGGRKRKIPIEKRGTKEQRSVTFCKRRRGLFTKAAELSHSSGAQIVILTTSPCLNSSSFYSFSSHSSALQLVHSYLNNKPPPRINPNPNPNPNPNSRFWWENPNLDNRHDLLSRLERTRNQVLACLAKRGHQIGSSSLIGGAGDSEVKPDWVTADENYNVAKRGQQIGSSEVIDGAGDSEVKADWVTAGENYNLCDIINPPEYSISL